MQAIERVVVGRVLVGLDLDRGAVVALDPDVAERVVDRELLDRVAGRLDRRAASAR